jgi:hypothetical protein
VLDVWLAGNDKAGLTIEQATQESLNFAPQDSKKEMRLRVTLQVYTVMFTAGTNTLENFELLFEQKYQECYTIMIQPSLCLLVC